MSALGEDSVEGPKNRGKSASDSGRPNRLDECRSCFSDVVRQCLRHGIEVVQSETLLFEPTVTETLRRTRVFTCQRELTGQFPSAHGSWLKTRHVAPQPRWLSIFVPQTVGICTVTDVSERNSRNDLPSLQETCRRILHEPPFRLQMPDYF